MLWSCEVIVDQTTSWTDDSIMISYALEAHAQRPRRSTNSQDSWNLLNLTRSYHPIAPHSMPSLLANVQIAICHKSLAYGSSSKACCFQKQTTTHGVSLEREGLRNTCFSESTFSTHFSHISDMSKKNWNSHFEYFNMTPSIVCFLHRLP